MLLLFNVGAVLIADVIGFVYPAWASFKAIESSRAKEDPAQWLTYWILFGFLHLLEYFHDTILYWFPFYYTFKVIGLMYLFLPQTMVRSQRGSRSSRFVS